MTIEDVIAKAKENMVLVGKAFADKGATTYTTNIHHLSVGYALEKAAGQKQLTAADFTQLVTGLCNHSAWRQVLVEREVYPAPTDKKAKTANVESQMAELKEEMGDA